MDIFASTTPTFVVGQIAQSAVNTATPLIPILAFAVGVGLAFAFYTMISWLFDDTVYRNAQHEIDRFEALDKTH